MEKIKMSNEEKTFTAFGTTFKDITVGGYQVLSITECPMNSSHRQMLVCCVPTNQGGNAFSVGIRRDGIDPNPNYTLIPVVEMPMTNAPAPLSSYYIPVVGLLSKYLRCSWDSPSIYHDEHLKRKLCYSTKEGAIARAEVLLGVPHE